MTIVGIVAYFFGQPCIGKKQKPTIQRAFIDMFCIFSVQKYARK